MRKSTTLLAVPALTASMLLTGCGGSTKTATTTTAAASSTAAASAGAAGSASASSVCPTDNTQAFAKTRFVTNVGLAAGAFHRWIYKPYQDGKFTKGADGRTVALVKAGLAGAFSAKQLKDATENVKADPTLCKVLYGPMTALTDQVSGLKDKITSGDLAAITGTAATVDSVLKTAKDAGVDITPDENASIG